MLSQNTPIEITAFWRGIFRGREGDELRVWHALSQKVDVVLDIGANTGIYSLVAATNTNAAIYAFEPVPFVFSLLEENVALNNLKNIVPVQNVVSESEGTVELFIPREGWVDVASVERSHVSRYAAEEDQTKIECQSVTVDAFLLERSHQNQLVLAKVDVEGAEKKVVQGMSRLLDQKKIIVLAELLNKPAYDEVVALLPKSYSVYGVVHGTPYTKPVDGYVKGIKNYFLIPRDIASILNIE
jgi:FkbM family methyltransferase